MYLFTRWGISTVYHGLVLIISYRPTGVPLIGQLVSLSSRRHFDSLLTCFDYILRNYV